MEGIGIFSDDTVGVDKSMEFTNHMVPAIYDGEYWLVSESEAYPPIHIDDKLGFSVWGAVTAVVRKL